MPVLCWAPRPTHLLNKISHISSDVSVRTMHSRKQRRGSFGEWPDQPVRESVGGGVLGMWIGGGGWGVNEVRSCQSQPAPEERRQGGKSNLKEGETVPTGDRGVLRPNALWSRAQSYHGANLEAALCTTPLAFFFFFSPRTASPERRRTVVPPLRIWIKHRAFVARIYRRWNVDRVKKAREHMHSPLNWEREKKNTCIMKCEMSLRWLLWGKKYIN